MMSRARRHQEGVLEIWPGQEPRIVLRGIEVELNEATQLEPEFAVRRAKVRDILPCSKVDRAGGPGDRTRQATPGSVRVRAGDYRLISAERREGDDSVAQSVSIAARTPVRNVFVTDAPSEQG
jgi:hypothetical protein